MVQNNRSAHSCSQWSGDRGIKSGPTRFQSRRVGRRWGRAAAEVVLALSLALMAGTSAAGAITYAYDELGRLVGVDPTIVSPGAI